MRDTHSKSIDSSNDRLPHCGHPVPMSQEVSTITFLEGPILHLFNVRSSWKINVRFTADTSSWTDYSSFSFSIFLKHPLGSLTSKGSVTAGDNDSSDICVSFESVQGPTQLRHQPITQSVERLRPVQLDETHVALLTSLIHQDILILSACVVEEQTLQHKITFYITYNCLWKVQENIKDYYYFNTFECLLEKTNVSAFPDFQTLRAACCRRDNSFLGWWCSLSPRWWVTSEVLVNHRSKGEGSTLTALCSSFIETVEVTDTSCKAKVQNCCYVC